MCFCCKTCSNSCGYCRSEVTADGCCAYKHDFGLEFVDNSCKSLSIRLCSVCFKFGIVNNDDPVCTVFGKFVCKALYIGTDEDCGNFLGVKICSKSFSFSDKLEGNAAEFVIYLLRSLRP